MTRSMRSAHAMRWCFGCAGVSIGLVLSAATIAGHAQSAASRSPEQALVDLERRLVAAIGARDLVAYDQLVADDYVVVNADGTERTKADVIASYKAGAQGYRGLEISEVKAHVFGDTGIVHARTLGFRIDGGKETPNRVRYVRVFARRGGRWQAVMQMAQPLPAQQQ